LAKYNMVARLRWAGAHNKYKTAFNLQCSWERSDDYNFYFFDFVVHREGLLISASDRNW